MKRHFILVTIALLVALIGCSDKKATPASILTPQPAQPAPGFIKANGNTLVDADGKPLLLKGVAFGNEVWSMAARPSQVHHGELDFERVKAMNMNAVRFYMSYTFFEDDTRPYTYKPEGWAWLDQNVAWAKKNGIYLVLNIHVPQGGFQSQGNGDALWGNEANQNRLIGLWQAIAERYQNEKSIIGYGLLNEPIPTQSVAQWSSLAQRIITAIRRVDANHVVFVERAINIKSGAKETEDFNFPVVTDPNVVYEFHIYDPFLYTHQLFDWAGLGEGGAYPDENRISYTNSSWYTGTFNNTKAVTGSSDWRFYEGIMYKINDPKIKVGFPAMVASKVGGRVLFDDFVIKEFDPSGVFLGDIISSNFDDLGSWNYWSNNNTGKVLKLATGGRGGSSGLGIEGATDDCNSSNGNMVFVPKPGHFYQMSGWMKGENIANNASAQFRIDFLTTNDPVLGRNKQLLENSLKTYTEWAKRKNVPLYLGEFGAGIHCFRNNRGGTKYVGDMLDIIKTNNLSFTYHVYHEDHFGLYFGYATTLPNPNNANTPLIELLTQKLR